MVHVPKKEKNTFAAPENKSKKSYKWLYVLLSVFILCAVLTVICVTPTKNDETLVKENVTVVEEQKPDAVTAAVGGGSNSMGMFAGFLNDPVDIYGIEPLGRGPKLGDHAASLKYGTEGIMHGFNSIMLKDENGEPAPVYSVASGLDYPSSGPEHAFLRDLGRVKYDVIDDEETIDAFYKLARLEGIIPAIESSHAVAFGMKLAKTMDHGSILINLSGRGDKDMDYVIENYGIR